MRATAPMQETILAHTTETWSLSPPTGMSRCYRDKQLISLFNGRVCPCDFPVI